MKTLLLLNIATIFSAGLGAQELVPQQSEAEQDIADFTESIIAVGEALNHTAAVLERERAAFMAMPIERRLAVLNANPARSLAVIQSRIAIGTAINSQLNALNIPRYSNRAPVDTDPDIEYDAEAGEFVAVPEPEPEE